MGKRCILEDNKICNDCQDCNYCDLDSNKICDNCAKCIDQEGSFISLSVRELADTSARQKLAKAKIASNKGEVKR